MRAATAVLALALLATGCREHPAPASTASTHHAAANVSWSPPPAGSAYAETLSALCVRTHAAHDANGVAHDTDVLARKLPHTIAIDRRFVAELQELVPPPPAVAEHQRLVDLFTTVVQYEQYSLRHLQAKSWNGYFIYMDTALVLRLETDKLTRRLGAPACFFRPFHGAD